MVTIIFSLRPSKFTFDNLAGRHRSVGCLDAPPRCGLHGHKPAAARSAAISNADLAQAKRLFLRIDLVDAAATIDGVKAKWEGRLHDL
jgi:hypothetical protein